jgi:hypothetical protein
MAAFEFKPRKLAVEKLNYKSWTHFMALKWPPVGPVTRTVSDRLGLFTLYSTTFAKHRFKTGRHSTNI